MESSRYAQLLAEGLAPEPFVRRALALLEADFREQALLALADWEALGLVTPELFQAVASLQRPSWGSWNGLLTALRGARRTILRTGSAPERDRIAQALDLQRVLDRLDEDVGRELAAALAPLAELTHVTLGRRVKRGAALAMPITLRNLVAHTAPVDPDWWRQAAEALVPLLDWLARQPAALPAAPSRPLPSPWFLPDEAGGDPWTFNGLHGDSAVVYSSAGGGAPRTVSDKMPEVLQAFNRLLGKEGLREDNIKRLLARLAPEEVKGVLLGDYLVGRPVKQGGFGTVHVGLQLSTGRKVAVKVLHDGMPEDVRARLRQEAAYLSQLDHANVVRVLGYGEDAWTPPRLISLADEPWYQEFSRSAPVKSYLVMEWVDGLTLEEVYQRGKEQAPAVTTLAEWFGQAAGALGAVHGAGLIHRDVKPSNLMVTPEGRVTLMDFGIARSQGEARTLQTTPGHVLGTPAYMAPEQVRASDPDAEVGPAADVYSLSATFYELFTGTRLFRHDTETARSVETRKLKGERPEPPRRHVRSLPWEIETILLAGLEPEAADRYRSMADLKRDLDHFLRREPIEYRRPSALRRLRLWTQRNPWVAGLSGALVSLLLVSAIAASFAAFYFRYLSGLEAQARHDAESAGQEERRQRWRSQDLVVRGFTRQGTRALDAGNLLGALPWYAEGLKWDRDEDRAAEDPDFRRREQLHRVRLATLLEQSPRLVQAWFHGGAVNHVAFSSDGRLVVTSCEDFTARVWDAVSGQAVTPPLVHDDPVKYAAFSRDGRFVVTACGDPTGRRGQGKARVWDVSTGKAVTPPLRHPGLSRKSNLVRRAMQDPAPDYVIRNVGVITHAAFSPDGRLVATASDDRTARLWNAATGAPVGQPLRHAESVPWVEFSPDGKWLATASEDGTARVWNTADTTPVTPYLKHPIALSLATFSPDGRLLATVGTDRTARLWDLTRTNPTPRTLALQGFGADARFSPDGRHLALVDDSGPAVVELATGQTVRIPHAQARTAAFSPDGRRLVTAGGDVRIWDAATGRPLAPPLSHGAGLAAFNPDGRHVVTMAGNAAWLWDVSGDPTFTPTLAKRREAASFALSRDGSLVAVAWGSEQERGKYGAAQVWNTTTGGPLTGLLEHAGTVVDVAFSVDGRRVATAAADGTARVWDATTGGAVTGSLKHPAAVRQVVFSPDAPLQP